MTAWKNVPKKTLLKKSYVRVVDDEEDVRTSMALLLRLAGIDVRTYESAADLLENGEFETPGCLVLDIRMPGMDGLRLQETLIARHVDLPILFLTGHGDVEMAVRALKRGAVDFLLKPPEEKKIVDAVEKAISLGVRLFRENAEAKIVLDRWNDLTARERDVMLLVAKGLMNKQIADVLGISEKTVQQHRGSACRKLDLRNAVEAAAYLSEVREAEKHLDAGRKGEA